MFKLAIRKIKLPKKIYLMLALIVIGWALILNICAFSGLKVFNFYKVSSPREGLRIWQNWDAKFYLWIADSGYNIVETNDPGKGYYKRTAFFPAYPMTVKLLHYPASLFGLDMLTVSLIVNLCLTIGAVIFLYKIAYLFKKDDDYAFKTVVYFLIFPFSFFLFAPYSEAMFAFFTLGFFYFLFSKNYLVAALFGVGATATRFIGVLLPLTMFLYYLEQQKWQLRKLNLKIIFLSLYPFLGILAYMVYLKITFGNFLFFAETEKYWRPVFSLNIFKTFYLSAKDLSLHPSIAYFRLTELFAVVFFMVLGAISLKKINVASGVFVLLSIILPLITGTTLSLNRFTIQMFPAFLILGLMYKNRVLEFFYILLSILLLGVFITAFVHGFWVA